MSRVLEGPLCGLSTLLYYFILSPQQPSGVGLTTGPLDQSGSLNWLHSRPMVVVGGQRGVAMGRGRQALKTSMSGPESLQSFYKSLYLISVGSQLGETGT